MILGITILFILFQSTRCVPAKFQDKTSGVIIPRKITDFATGVDNGAYGEISQAVAVSYVLPDIPSLYAVELLSCEAAICTGLTDSECTEICTDPRYQYIVAVEALQGLNLAVVMSSDCVKKHKAFVAVPDDNRLISAAAGASIYYPIFDYAGKVLQQWSGYESKKILNTNVVNIQTTMRVLDVQMLLVDTQTVYNNLLASVNTVNDPTTKKLIWISATSIMTNTFVAMHMQYLQFMMECNACIESLVSGTIRGCVQEEIRGTGLVGIMYDSKSKLMKALGSNPKITTKQTYDLYLPVKRSTTICWLMGPLVSDDEGMVYNEPICNDYICSDLTENGNYKVFTENKVNSVYVCGDCMGPVCYTDEKFTVKTFTGYDVITGGPIISVTDTEDYDACEYGIDQLGKVIAFANVVSEECDEANSTVNIYYNYIANLTEYVYQLGNATIEEVNIIADKFYTIWLPLTISGTAIGGIGIVMLISVSVVFFLSFTRIKPFAAPLKEKYAYSRLT